MRQVRDRFEGMGPRLSVMDPSPARVPGFDGALRRPPAGRVNLQSAPTPIRLSVVDHLQEIEDAVTALWCRLYAPPAMPWATSIAVPPVADMLKACWSCQRLNRLPDIGLIWHDWERLVRKTLGIIDVPPSRHGIGRCLNPLCGVELSAEVGAVSVDCPVCGNTYRVVDVRLGFLRECIDRAGVHGGGVRGAAARMRIPMQCEHDSLMA